jgi:transposase
VHRCNREGIAGLRDRPRSGRKPRLTPAPTEELAAVVEQGPEPDRDGVVRWRRVDLQAVIATRFGVRLHERSVGKVLRRLGFTRLSVHPTHPTSDPEAQEAFKKALERQSRLAVDLLREWLGGDRRWPGQRRVHGRIASRCSRPFTCLARPAAAGCVIATTTGTR